MVIGCGTIELIFILLFKRLYNAKVAAVDIDDRKLKTSKKFGDTKQFTASDFPAGGGSINWESLDTGIATIGSNGLATGVSPGTVTIRAYKTVGASTHQAFASLTVIPASLPPALVSIGVTPANHSINLGATQQFTATGTYSDSSTSDITNSVAWNSSDMSIATIDGNSGLATGVGDGSVTITATLDLISGNTGLTVNLASNPTVPLKSVHQGASYLGFLENDCNITLDPGQVIWHLVLSPVEPNNGSAFLLDPFGTNVDSNGTPVGNNYGTNHGGSIQWYILNNLKAAPTWIAEVVQGYRSQSELRVSHTCYGGDNGEEPETGCITIYKEMEGNLIVSGTFTFDIYDNDTGTGDPVATASINVTDNVPEGPAVVCGLTIGQTYYVEETGGPGIVMNDNLINDRFLAASSCRPSRTATNGETLREVSILPGCEITFINNTFEENGDENGGGNGGGTTTTTTTKTTITKTDGTIEVLGIQELPDGTIEVLGIQELPDGTIEVLGIQELPFTGHNWIYYVIGMALIMAGGFTGISAIKLLKRKEE